MIDVISGVFMGGVALITCVDLAASAAAVAGPAPRARPSPERRCPFCHQSLLRDVARARCAGCGTAHHALCWDDHGGCSVFGCGSLVRVGVAIPGQAEAGVEAEVLPDLGPAPAPTVGEGAPPAEAPPATTAEATSAPPQAQAPAAAAAPAG